MRVLLLGGTAEARDLAARLVGLGIPVTSSLAGRVSRPRLPEGQVRIGGFGGAAGLADHVRDQGVTHLVDATHPFATTMTEHAVAAASAADVPLVRLARPGWGGRADTTDWRWCASLAEVRQVAGGLGRRPFVSSGRQTLPAFASWADREVLVRVVEPLDGDVPEGWTVVEDRGPYALDGELELMARHRVDVLVTKDSGGGYTAAKLDAAARLGIPVVLLARPEPPAGLIAVTTVEDVLGALGVGAAAPRG
ncbi:cobalt-precorrin-6A reductase [Pedococcus sp. NPDC057267]|uniref:cobalt-precorrin-6A reductase n=1 Tax=Pedococcus sp. NPDC057267 TaxID=3346077 RepID=UPI00362AE0E2